MAKFSTKYLMPKDLFDFNTHWAVGLEYPFRGSKGEYYTVEVTKKGLTCNCTGMMFRGKCKHSESVAQRWRDVFSEDFEEKFLTAA